LAVSWNPFTNSKLNASANARNKRKAVGMSMPRVASTRILLVFLDGIVRDPKAYGGGVTFV
jgi:hypothetical protein